MIISLCGADWIVEFVNKDDSRLEGDNDGITLFDNQTILIKDELVHHRRAVTLTHELLHVICDFTGIPENGEETLIRNLEHHIYELIKKFPEEYK